MLISLERGCDQLVKAVMDLLEYKNVVSSMHPVDEVIWSCDCSSPFEQF